MPQSPLKLFNQPVLNCYPALPCLPHGNSSKGYGLGSPLTPCSASRPALLLPRVAQHAVPIFLGKLQVTAKVSFSGTDLFMFSLSHPHELKAPGYILTQAQKYKERNRVRRV